MHVVYYVVGYDDDIRHGVITDPWRWTAATPTLPMDTLCGRTLIVALPGADRPVPRSPLPSGENPFCADCTRRDLALPTPVRQVLTTQGWRQRVATQQRNRPCPNDT